jgi:NAD(P)-dependent dehydrogenase (short-subunit alcohol dehydrogenase family)
VSRPRVAVVTGAAGGIGAAIAARLVADGFAVAGLDVTGPGDVEGVEWHRCDVTDPDAVRSTVAEVVERSGGVDVLVNDAGLLSGRASFLEATPEQMHRFFDVNAVGVLLMTQACFPHLRDAPAGGRVVNLGSRTFFTGAPGQLAYVASKGAVIGMTRVMARELGEHRITVNAVVPAQVETPGTRAHSGPEVFARTRAQQAIPEPVTGVEVAGMVSHLAGPDGRLTTGQCLVVDGGGLLH